jgi:hypothetical protein
MRDILLKIRWSIDFIKEEIEKVNGSSEVKKEILENCELFNKALSDCCSFDINKEKTREIMKPAFSEFDKTIKKIKNDDDNKTLFMLLITNIADIKFLLSSEEEQKRITEIMKKKMK